MPNYIFTGQTVELVTRTQSADTESQASLNVYYGRCTAFTGVGCTDQEFVDAVSPLLAALYKPTIDDTTTYLRTTVRIIGGAIVLPTRVSAIGSGLGTAQNPYLPTQVSALATFRTDYGGPAGRGRKYYGFVPATFQVAADQISVPSQVLYQAIANWFLIPVNVAGAGGTALVAWGLRDKAGAHFYPYVSAQASPYLATQRRRGAYGRRNPST